MKSTRLAASRRILLIAVLALAGAALVGPSSAFATPAVSISGGIAPGGVTNANDVTFALSMVTSATKDVDFFCSMDSEFSYFPCDAVNYPACPISGPTKACTQSKSYQLLTSGTHTFRAFAAECDSPCEIDVSGVEGPLASVSFTVDRTAPTLAFVSGPSDAAPLVKGIATFAFSASEASTYVCSIDARSQVPCASPFSLGPLKNGDHELIVLARDAAGNFSAPLALKFVVDIFKPKKCKKAKSKKGKAKYAKCKKANAAAKAKWKKRHKL